MSLVHTSGPPRCNGYDYGESVQQTTDGGYIIFGDSDNNGVLFIKKESCFAELQLYIASLTRTDTECKPSDKSIEAKNTADKLLEISKKEDQVKTA